MPPAISTNRLHPSWAPKAVRFAIRLGALAAAVVAAVAITDAELLAVVGLSAVKATAPPAVVFAAAAADDDDDVLGSGGGKDEGACQEPVGPAALRPKAPPTRTCTSSPTSASL